MSSKKPNPRLTRTALRQLSKKEELEVRAHKPFEGKRIVRQQKLIAKLDAGVAERALVPKVIVRKKSV